MANDLNSVLFGSDHLPTWSCRRSLFRALASYSVTSV